LEEIAQILNKFFIKLVKSYYTSLTDS